MYLESPAPCVLRVIHFQPFDPRGERAPFLPPVLVEASYSKIPTFRGILST